MRIFTGLCYNASRFRCAKRVETVQNMPSEWTQAVTALRDRLGTEVVNRWIEPLRVNSETDRDLVLEAPNMFFRDWVASHYAEVLQQILGERRITIVSSATGDIVLETLSPVETPRAPTPLPTPRVEDAPASSSSAVPEGSLNVKFTFDRFVIGPSNRFAHAASMAVAESPAKAYNPLFIYGGVGLGKTHLMQAIGHAIAQRSTSAKVVYLSSEQFTNELIVAIQTKTTSKFRDRYRTVDALLIDDIHFLAGRESTQEEFFHTFNALYDAHKQIVISSDRPPKEIAGLEERLVSRFAWGLVTDMQPPDLDTRVAILRKKAEEAGIAVPDAVNEFIARQITTNIRELEGALIRVVAYSRFFSKPLSASTAAEVLKDMVKEVGARISLTMIQDRVGQYFKISSEELRSVSRQRSVLYPRQLAMYLCRKLTDASLPEIGRLFGGKNHTTVLRAVAKIEQEIAQDEHKKHLVEYLSKLIASGEA